MSRASNLAGFVSAIYPSDNLSVGFLTARNLNVTGIATFGTLDISGVNYADVAGIATYAQTAGIATYAQTAGVATAAGTATYAVNAGVATVGGIGIQSGGSQIGTGVTIINFVGAGNSIRAVGDTVEISIAGSGGGGGGGGTGFSTTGIATVRGIANADDIIESITLDDYYGTGTNYAMIGPITVTGAGTTVTVGAGVSYVII